MSKKIISTLLITATTLSFALTAYAASPDTSFTDVSSDKWYYEAIEYVTDNNIVASITDTTFAPTDSMTRAAFVMALANISGVDSTTVADNGKFSDIDSTADYTTSVIWANENGIINGVTDTTFGPNDYITREQIAAILYLNAR
jgi:hypothetical protein